MTRFYFDTYDGSTWCADEDGLEPLDEQQALAITYHALVDLARDEIPRARHSQMIVRMHDETGSGFEVSLDMKIRQFSGPNR
jgi:hypothetical protein